MALIDPVWLNFTSRFDYKHNLNILKEMLFSRSFFIKVIDFETTIAANQQ